VIVPVAPVVALAREEEIDVVAIAVLFVPVAGADTLNVGFAVATTVEVMPEPQVLAEDWLLLWSPL
jgi:S-adenosylmethionine synthetase